MCDIYDLLLNKRKRNHLRLLPRRKEGTIGFENNANNIKKKNSLSVKQSESQVNNVK